ncbi:mitochondrial branched-chain alpha-ketoacid dehydrogenase kinase-domain-containing protein [Dunaliella salina]|uniref:Protein-serine/threonine kinase n=1 Tax=Dunaliella salina TaxID=3046 RepID=A0ABQ7GB66_DUNSA|nr:mitochondrial branched-chain alpha-ketoacid dehydrogenase kinase-domain-containing protein [Dunaliella salina]|eukprot:KAF5831855.1 mitochondrial branched-chain alpha-ketoacid dehydrogenase kinase-domain-containing protein [Dunaliella salina]
MQSVLRRVLVGHHQRLPCTWALQAYSNASAAATKSNNASTVAKGVRLMDVHEQSLVDDIFSHALKKQTGVSLKYMLDFGANPIERQLILSAQFLHKELPVRLAHRVAELENLPYGLSAKSSILKVRDWYVDSFKELRQFPPITNAQDEANFTMLLRSIYRRHANVVPVMAKGVSELRMELIKQQSAERVLSEMPEVHQFLDGFYLSRIGIRILIGQHIALHEPPKDDHIGLICTACSPVQVAQDAINDARSICLREYGSSPEVMVYGAPEFVFPYVPSHLHHMVFELVKNSLRAVQDKYEDALQDSPPIRVVVAEGMEDVTIKVSDEGGGIPRSGMPNIWTYLYSTANHPVQLAEQDIQPTIEDSPVVLAGYGYGLPISRLYARYFGGDLQIISMEGYGTDAYLHLNRLGNSQEPLP